MPGDSSEQAQRQSHEDNENGHHQGGEQAQGDRGQELPVLELVLRQLVDVEEHRSHDAEVDAEVDARGDDRAEKCPSEAAPPGRATSRISMTTITGLDSIPP